ncbi:MAG TPA: hypothetical protein VM347_07925 [Nonomuraea sp.]|nr:hypothetical protein [Nonomuraea sp.]
MNDDDRDLSGERCPTCGAMTLKKRLRPYEKVTKALLSVVIRIIMWKVTGE